MQLQGTLWGTRQWCKEEEEAHARRWQSPSSLLLWAAHCSTSWYCLLGSWTSNQSIQGEEERRFFLTALMCLWLKYHLPGSLFHTLQAWKWPSSAQWVPRRVMSAYQREAPERAQAKPTQDGQWSKGRRVKLRAFEEILRERKFGKS